jgi:hypothetical protein
MALLVELERADAGDYALLFEYLQDIAILDSPNAPTRAILLQVKKKARGEWTRTSLCRKGAAEDATLDVVAEPPLAASPKKGLGGKSPLGKLYLCVDRLQALVPTQGVFVSNAGHTLKQDRGAVPAAHTRLGFDNLHSEDAEYITKRIAAELKQDALPHFARMAIEQSKVSPVAMRETVRGMIDMLLSQKFASLPNVSGRLQEKLLAAFSACSGPKPVSQSLSEVVSHKGFIRSAFTKLLQELASTRSAPEALDTVVDGLKSEGYAPRLADALRTEANRLQIQLMRHPETRETLAWDFVVGEAQKHAHQTSYISILEAVSSEILKRATARTGGPSNEREAGALALLALIHVDEKPPASSSKSQSEEK